MAKCVILSGIPGSGKSTFAKALLSGKVCSADDYFMVDGEYKFDVKLLADAHGACLRKFVHAISSGSDVIVDNTNLSAEEIVPYYALAAAWGYDIKLITFKCDVETAIARNVHGVPEDGIRAMAKNLEERKLPDYWKYNDKFETFEL